jgi:hypothetical protein
VLGEPGVGHFLAGEDLEVIDVAIQLRVSTQITWSCRSEIIHFFKRGNDGWRRNFHQLKLADQHPYSLRRSSLSFIKIYPQPLSDFVANCSAMLAANSDLMHGASLHLEGAGRSIVEALILAIGFQYGEALVKGEAPGAAPKKVTVTRDPSSAGTSLSSGAA